MTPSPKKLSLLLVALVAATALTPIATSAQDTGTRIKEKLIVFVPTKLDHPWATHMYRSGCEILAACVNNHEGVRAIVSPQDDWPDNPKLVEDADSLVFYSRPAADLVLGPRHRDQAAAYFNRGGGFAAIHWATGTTNDQYGDDYLNILGGWFSFAHSGLKVDRAQLLRLEAEHAVSRGWEPFEVRDEFYLNLKYRPEATPIAAVEVDGVRQTIAWVMERPDGGRSFGSTLAHFHDNFGDESFRRVLVNGLLWSARADVPPEGADVRLNPRRLALPDNPNE